MRVAYLLLLGLALPACKKKEVSGSSPNDTNIASKSIIKGIPKPLRTELTGYLQTDRLDVGDEADESAHGYVIEKPTYAGTHQFEWPATKAVYQESGRATRSFESFKIKVTPLRDHMVVRAFDTLAKDQKLTVSVNGKAVGDWVLPDGGSTRYGEATFPLPAAVVGDRTELTLRMDYVSGTPDTNAFVYWVMARGTNGLPGPLKTDLVGLVLSDRIDVGDRNDEAVHQYVIDRPTYAGTHEFAPPKGNVKYLETGRATKTFESFRLKTKPNANHVLVKAYDTLSRDQKIRVSVDGTSAGEWVLGNDGGRYGESTFPIAKDLVGDKTEITVRVDFVSGSIDTNSFYYWLYAAEGALGIAKPLKTDIQSMVLTDRVDVGNEASEREHAYAIEGQTFAGKHKFEWKDQVFVEDGRATKSSESFRVKVRPRSDHVLIKAFDTLSKNQKVRVLVDGKPLTEWALPGGDARYGEAQLKIPARVIGEQDSVALRFEFLAGSIDFNTFAVWIYARSSPPATPVEPQ
jgi:hypothetical protein